MEQTALISVIVPIYKVEAYLPKCVDSLLNQTYRNLEIVLVDDGSPDGCGAICDDYAAKDSRIRVIHKQNGGLSSARNAGIDMAKGDYIAFVDSDDWLEPDAYESMLDAALRHDAPMVCAGRYDVDGSTGEREVGLCPEKEETITGKELVGRIFLWDHLDSAAWDKLYTRDLFREIRYPLGKIVEDVPTTYRIALKAGKVVMLNKPVYNYLHRPNSITTASVSEKTFHFSQHTARVYADICTSVPELEPQARYLRVRSLVYSVQTLELADSATREKFSDQYWESRNELKQHLQFILKSPYFTRRERLDDTLLALGLYRNLRKVYYVISRHA